LALKTKKNDWGCDPTGSDDNYHYRFVSPTGSGWTVTYHCQFKPITDSDLMLSLSVLANTTGRDGEANTTGLSRKPA
jgi:hypothetical protein